MSNMENLDRQLSEKERQEAVYENAMRLINLKDRSRDANGEKVMSAVMGFGEGALGDGKLSKVNHFAKLFCIGFTLLLPSLLVWDVLL
ncbi:MAG: hypothetical protein AB8B62_17180 [Roseobacter sp.]